MRLAARLWRAAAGGAQRSELVSSTIAYDMTGSQLRTASSCQTRFTWLAYTMPPCSSDSRSGLCPIVRASSALSALANCSPGSPAVQLCVPRQLGKLVFEPLTSYVPSDILYAVGYLQEAVPCAGLSAGPHQEGIWAPSGHTSKDTS